MAQEKQFEKKVKDFLKVEGCWVLKTWSNGVQRKGVPDLLVGCNGYLLGVELKAPNGKPSELQLHEIREMHKSGCIAFVLKPRNFDTFKSWIRGLKEDGQDTYYDIYDVLSKGSKELFEIPYCVE